MLSFAYGISLILQVRADRCLYLSDAVELIPTVYFSSFLISGIVFYTIYINSIISVIFLTPFFVRFHEQIHFIMDE
jgi:hypothetical protein